MSSFCVNIIKDKKIVGNSFHVMCWGTVETLNYINKLINNYNKNLVDKNLPNEVLAHRILTQEDIDESLCEFRGRLCEKSHKYYKEHFSIPLSDDNTDICFGRIAIIPGDISSNNMEASREVTIDLDTNTIHLTRNFIKIETKDDYCKRNNVDPSEFNIGDIPTSLINMRGFYFNELEEAREFLKENKCWKDNYHALYHCLI